MQSSEDSLWESFPQELQSRDGVGRYINAFQAPFQELSLTYDDVYILRVCSCLVIPSPTGRAVPQGGFPTDLMQINLSAWASLAQDVAAGLQVLPPGFSNCLDPKVLNLLHRLEAVTQVKFCHLCYYPGTNCRCAGVPPTSPPTSWSRIMEQTLGYGVTTSSTGVTTLTTSLGGMSGYVPPPPGISLWNMPPLEDSIPKGPVTILRYQPPAGRTEQLRAAMSMRGLMPWTAQMPPPICQPPLLSQSRPATQLMQLLSKTSGFDSSVFKPAPAGSQDMDVHGRQAT